MSNKYPLAGLIHNISKSQMKYLKLKYDEFNLDHDVVYVMIIYDNPNISQDQLVDQTGQSKGNMAKILKKLEDEGFIKRKINPENRRKYMLKTTSKGDKLVPQIRQISLDWEKEVGITDEDYKLKERLRQIALKSSELIK
ncbi:MAG: MarR family transcriptional regulator [Methanobrevibacter sp.]|nr:MarR family transcriptional regulator [Methanobrevibacter sp.]